MADYDVALSAAGYILRLTATETSVDVTNNQSTVTWSLSILKGSGSGKWSNYATYWSVNIGGVGYSGSRSSYDFRPIGAGGAIVWGSGTTVLTHNNDGALTISVAGSFSESVTLLGAGTASGPLVLTTIPRATTATLTPNPIDAGQTVTIGLPRASGSFTHNVEYIFGSATGSIATGAGTSTSWAIPLSILNEIPNSTSGVGIIRTTTYSGATLIGVKDTPITITVPTAVVPDFTTITNTEATSGVAANIGAYVQGITTLALAITGSVGAYGSTIASTGYKIEVAGQTINAQSGTTPTPLALSGTYNITGTVTDSRGRTKSKTVSITVLAYVPPTLIAMSAQRALSSGTPDDEGVYIRTNINAAVQSLIVGGTQKNELVYRIYTRDHATGGAFTLKKTVSTGAVTFNSYDIVSSYAITQSWDVRIEVSDDFATSAIQFVVTVSTIFQHWDADLGMGLGKYRENGQLDVLGQIFQNDGAKVIDEEDVATTAIAGISELATTAETLAGTDSSRTITPAGLAGARDGGMFDNRFYTETEIDNKLILLGSKAMIPSAVVVASGSASVAATGVVTFTGCTSVALDGVFDGLGADTYEIIIEVTSALFLNPQQYIRLRKAGVSISASTYNRLQIYTYSTYGPTRGNTFPSTEFAYISPVAGTIAPVTRAKITITRPNTASKAPMAYTNSHISYSDRYIWNEVSDSNTTQCDGFVLSGNGSTMSGTIVVRKIA